MLSRKDFMLEVATKLSENPRAVLAGHGISANVLQELVKRKDIQAKLAGFLYSTIYAKKGAMGLKKASGLKISGYKSFPEFNLKARTDVETFMEGLDAKDQASFTNNGNILVLYFKPQATNVDELSESEELTTGLSLKVTFDTAISKEMKSLGGMYVTVMFGDSIIRTAEMKKAEREAKKNARIQTRRTPAKLKAELKAKANKKILVLKKKRAELQQKAYNTAAELEQFGAIGSQFGAKQGSVRSLIGKMGAMDSGVEAIKDAIANDPENRKLIAMAQNFVKKGDIKMAKTLLAEVGNSDVSAYVLGGSNDAGSAGVIKARKAKIKATIKQLTAKNEQLLVDLALAGSEGAKRSVRSMISKNNSKIKQFRAKLGTYKDMSITAVNNKAKMLKEIHAAIEANISQGASIQQALNASLNDLDAKAGEKQIIKQQIMQQVANDIPVQYAVQQALQQFTPQQTGSALGGSMDLDTLMSTL